MPVMHVYFTCIKQKTNQQFDLKNPEIDFFWKQRKIVKDDYKIKSDQNITIISQIMPNTSVELKYVHPFHRQKSK